MTPLTGSIFVSTGETGAGVELGPASGGVDELNSDTLSIGGDEDVAIISSRLMLTSPGADAFTTSDGSSFEIGPSPGAEAEGTTELIGRSLGATLVDVVGGSSVLLCSWLIVLDLADSIGGSENCVEVEGGTGVVSDAVADIVVASVIWSTLDSPIGAKVDVEDDVSLVSGDKADPGVVDDSGTTVADTVVGEMLFT